jgi:riboflavin kinase/FMN adenylyltransferase
VPLLTTLDERRALLESLGVERVVVLPFTRDLAEMSPEAYVRDVLLGSIGMREIVIGYDHRFGRKASGTRETLEGLAKTMGFGVDVMPAHVSNGVAVSSTGVRRLLIDEGDARAAAALLGRPYSLSGVVVRGNQRGRTIGFPTANVEPSESAKLIPKIGVYAVRAAVAGGERIDGMMNIGRRPTFESDGAVSIEVHLFDFDAEIYGRSLKVHVVERVRDERRFDGPEALVAQLREDRGQAANALSGLV